MIPYSIRRRIIDETNIVEVVSEYIPLTKKGNSHFGVCPFHDDKNPSMSVSNKVKMFNCFSCTAKGNVIDFVSRYENISIDQATVKLADRLGIVIKKEVSKQDEKQERLLKIMKEASDFYSFILKNSEEGKNALKYLSDRGISNEIIDRFKIGLSPSLKDSLYSFLSKKGYSELDLIELGLVKSDNNDVHDIFRQRIMFPLADKYGNVVGFSGRIYLESNQAKYINSNENVVFHKSEVLYNLHNAALHARKLNKIYVFEGFMDVIAAERANVLNGIATMGTALTKEHINNILSLTKNIVLCFDGDVAGINAMKKAAMLFANYNIIPDAVVLPDNLDPDEYLKEYGAPRLNTYLISKARNVYSWLYDLAIKDLVISDITSIEKFKKNVFEFISFSKQDTIVEFYLSKLANDLHVDISTIQNDYVKIANSFVNNNNNEVLKPTQPKNNVQSIVIKNLVVPKKIKKAYQIIIKHCLFNNDRLLKYIEETDKLYISDELIIEFSIINLIHDEQVLANNLELNIGTDKINLKALAEDETYNEYIQSILNNKFIDIDNIEDFNQSLDEIIRFIKKNYTRVYKNRVLEGDQNAFSEFIQSKKAEEEYN